VHLSGPQLSIDLSHTADLPRFIRATTACPASTRTDLNPVEPPTDAALITEQLSRLGGTTRYHEVLPHLLHWANA
jgi:hypothetical protein